MVTELLSEVASASATEQAIPRHPRRSLSANLLWTLAGNAIYSACQWGMLVGIVRVGHVELAGRYALALTITAPLFMLTNMQMSGLLATDGSREFGFSDYRRVRWVGSGVALVGAVLIALVVPSYRVAILVIALMSIAKAIESGSDINYGLLQRHHRMDRVAKGLVLRGTLALASFVAALVLTASLPLSIAALAIAYAFIYLVYDRQAEQVVGVHQMREGGVARLNARQRAFALTRMALPLGVASMLTSVAVAVPRLFVEHYLGLAPLGVFSALAYLIVAGRLLALPFGLAVAPRLGDALAAGDYPGFRRLLGWLLGAGVILGAIGIIGALALGPWALRLLYGPTFGKFGPELVALMFAAAFGYLAIFIQSALTAARVVAAQTWLVALSLLFSAAALAMLVPRFGLLGAAAGMAVGSACELVCSAAVLSWRWRSLFPHVGQ